MGKKKRPRKKLSTFLDKPLESIANHLGKLIDRSNPDQLLDLFAAAFCAYGGYEAARKLGGDIAANLGVAGTGVLAYQLAKQPNLVAGASGVGYLASLGLINVWNPLTQAFETVIKYPVSTEPFDFWRIPWGAPIPVFP